MLDNTVDDDLDDVSESGDIESIRPESAAAGLGYEIRDYRSEQGGPAQIEAWLPGWLWPAVRAVERYHGWLVVVVPEVSAIAGVPEASRSGFDVITADEARTWHEWKQASKGRRQIMWSRQRKEPSSDRENLWNALLVARGMTAEESDEAVVAIEAHGEVVGEISRADWHRAIVWRPELIVEILESAEIAGTQTVWRSLAACGVEFIEHPPPVARLA